jgi:hypothetical protein
VIWCAQSCPATGSLIRSVIGSLIGITCELGPSARSVAGVQSHKDERDQGQHRHSHRYKDARNSLNEAEWKFTDVCSDLPGQDAQMLRKYNPTLLDRVDKLSGYTIFT